MFEQKIVVGRPSRRRCEAAIHGGGTLKRGREYVRLEKIYKGFRHDAAQEFAIALGAQLKKPGTGKTSALSRFRRGNGR